MRVQLAIGIFVLINFVVIGLSLTMGSLIVAFHHGARGWLMALTVMGWLMIVNRILVLNGSS